MNRGAADLTQFVPRIDGREKIPHPEPKPAFMTTKSLGWSKGLAER